LVGWLINAVVDFHKTRY